MKKVYEYKWRFTRGEHLYSIYFIPNIEYCKRDGYEYCCLNFLKWFIGFVK
jgi:hypothetical protein